MRDDDLAYRTYITRPDWVAIEPCEAEAALATLKATLQFGREPFPAWLWLAVGGAVIDPAFCGTWQQLAQAGVPPDQLQSLAFVYLASGGCEEEPACFAGSLLLLRMLLGSWPAAAEAAAEDPELLGLTLCGLPLKDGEPVPYALAPAPGIDPVLVALELRSLGGGLDEEQLLRLATCALIDGGRRVGAPRALGVLELLGTLFGGSAEAAMEAAAADPALWQLPYDRSAMWAAFDGLGRAGLSDAQLRRLARICCDHADDVGQLSCLAERLYGGDWRAAALEFLRGWRVYVERLCMLPRTLETLEHFDLAVANDAGRQRVLEQVKVRAHACRLLWAARWHRLLPAACLLRATCLPKCFRLCLACGAAPAGLSVLLLRSCRRGERTLSSRCSCQRTPRLTSTPRLPRRRWSSRASGSSTARRPAGSRPLPG